MTKHYLSMSDIGAIFGVSGATVSKWRTRYADTHPTPTPTVTIGTTPGWDTSTIPDWKAWRTLLPGQGAGGGPLPLKAASAALGEAYMTLEEESSRGVEALSRLALLAAGAEYGADEDTTMGVWTRVAREDPARSDAERDVRTLASIMRGRARPELTAGATEES